MPSKFSYQRLTHEEGGGGGFNEHGYQETIDKAIEHVRARTSWSSSCRLKRVHIKKRLKVKIPSLKKFLRRKARVVVASLAKVVKRLKDSQAHFGDLFAGNYLFMQVTPTPLKYAASDKSMIKGSLPHRFSSRDPSFFLVAASTPRPPALCRFRTRLRQEELRQQ